MCVGGGTYVYGAYYPHTVKTKMVKLTTQIDEIHRGVFTVQLFVLPEAVVAPGEHGLLSVYNNLLLIIFISDWCVSLTTNSHK